MSDKNIRILVCDDSILARKSLKGILSELGYENIIEVSNGQDAVDTCIKEKPDLVLLDIVMPVKDGVSATREIKEACPDTSVVIVSSVGTQNHITEAIKAGARDFLQKPIDSEMLNQVLNNI